MSYVYEASDLESGQRVAVKLLTSTDPEHPHRRLFQRSSQILCALDHIALPHVYALESECERLVLVREPFDGGSLWERILFTGTVDSQAFLDLLAHLLRLLEYLQGQSPPLIHRDVKPSNIMFRAREDWVPVLADFDTITTPDRSARVIVATEGYAAPEQRRGRPGLGSDLVGVAGTLLFALTGIEPHQLQADSGRPDVEGCLAAPPGLRTFFVRLLSPQRAERFACAADARRELDALLPALAGAGSITWRQRRSVVMPGIARVTDTMVEQAPDTPTARPAGTVVEDVPSTAVGGARPAPTLVELTDEAAAPTQTVVEELPPRANAPKTVIESVEG